MAPLALVTIALPHCLGLSYWLYQLVLSWYLHQPESHQLSFTNLVHSVSDNLTHRSDRSRDLGPIKISSGCQSDNFDPRRSAHGSSESKWPKFSETHAEKVSIFKIVGASPLQSQVIQKCCRQNRWFLGIFWEIMLSHGQTVDFRQ